LLILVGILGGYLVGSIPTAYLAVRLKARMDIRKEGSGNVGAFNAYDVTQSKTVGLIVGILDGVKGLAVALIAGPLFGGSFSVQAAALCGAIIGHNYPLWLKFQGGRGLAIAAGGMFGIGFSFMILWCLVWFIAYKWLKDILKANILAILLSPFLLLAVPDAWIDILSIRPVPATDFRLFSFMISGIHFLRHINPLKEIIEERCRK